MAGRFIAFEGGEGCGKSTQSQLLADYLRDRGITVEATREPGGTPGAEAIRSLLLDPPGEGWGAQAEALLFAAARADHSARRIRPALERGDWVISDRYLDSSRAYQGGAGGVGDETVLALHTIGSGGLTPDITILLDVDSQTAAARTRLRDGNTADAIGGRDAGYHAAVRDAFARMAAVEPGRFRLIDGSGDLESVHATIVDAISPLLADPR